MQRGGQVWKKTKFEHGGLNIRERVFQYNNIHVFFRCCFWKRCFRDLCGREGVAQDLTVCTEGAHIT